MSELICALCEHGDHRTCGGFACLCTECYADRATRLLNARPMTGRQHWTAAVVALAVLISVLAFLFAGCATYAEQPWTPDGLNYTTSIDHSSGHAVASYIGLTWNLKPERTER